MFRQESRPSQETRLLVEKRWVLTSDGEEKAGEYCISAMLSSPCSYSLAPALHVNGPLSHLKFTSNQR